VGTNRLRGQDPLAELLGLASLGLGIPQLLAPGRFAEAIGLRDDSRSRTLIRMVGIRELAAAAGILVLERPRPAGWLWARVAGDVKDLALLVAALATKPERPDRLGAAIAAVLGIGATDVVAATRITRRRRAGIGITVRGPVEEVKRRWQYRTEMPARFSPAPRDQGTEIRVDADGSGPMERLRAKSELRRFKQELETGIVVRSEGSPEGEDPRRLLRQRPARPPGRAP
jgi:hypothetical protein